jgi:hypothetical protein
MKHLMILSPMVGDVVNVAAGTVAQVNDTEAANLIAGQVAREATDAEIAVATERDALYVWPGTEEEAAATPSKKRSAAK